MRLPGYVVVALALLGGCASQPHGPAERDAAGGEVAIDLDACSRVGSDPEHKLSKDERLAEVRMALGAGYMQEGELDIALQELEKSLDLNPRSAPAHATMALLQLRLGKPDIAETHYRKALALSPSDPEIHNNYGVYLCGQNRPKEADAQFRCAIANPLYRTPAMAYTNAAECALRHGGGPRVDTDLQTAVQVDATYTPATLLLAEVSLQKGDAQMARTQLARFVRQSGQTPASLALGIRVESALGDVDRAASYRMLLKNQFPDSREAQGLN